MRDKELGMQNGIGHPALRKEDLRLVKGCGEFTDDINIPGQAYAVMVRAPHAHARIQSISTSFAEAAPGVLMVLTGKDFTADGLRPIPRMPFPPDLPSSIPTGHRVSCRRISRL